MTHEAQGKVLGQIIARVWEDETFRQRLLADTTAVLKKEGIAVPEGLEIRAVENTERVVHVVIPAKPAHGELTGDELDSVAGGTLRDDIYRFSEKIHKLVFCWDRSR